MDPHKETMDRKPFFVIYQLLGCEFMTGLVCWIKVFWNMPQLCRGDRIMNFANSIGNEWLETSIFISQPIDNIFRITPENVLFH